MDELLIRLSKAGIGCHVGNSFFCALCYADDVTLLSQSRNSMSQLLSLCEEFAEEHNVILSSTKSVLVTYNVNVDVSFMLNNVPIITADNAVYLANYIGKNCNQRNISQGVSNLIGRTNIICFRSLMCVHVPHLLNLFKTVCCDLFRSRDIDRICVTWRKLIRRWWNVPYIEHMLDCYQYC